MLLKFPGEDHIKEQLDVVMSAESTTLSHKAQKMYDNFIKSTAPKYALELAILSDIPSDQRTPDQQRRWNEVFLVVANGMTESEAIEWNELTSIPPAQQTQAHSIRLYQIELMRAGMKGIDALEFAMLENVIGERSEEDQRRKNILQAVLNEVFRRNDRERASIEAIPEDQRSIEQNKKLCQFRPMHLSLFIHD